MGQPDTFLYSVHLKDRFSDLGLIGAMEVVDGRLALFSLSCRALGREVEGHMAAFLKQRHEVAGIDFVSTGKNGSLKDLFGKEFPQIDLGQGVMRPMGRRMPMKLEIAAFVRDFCYFARRLICKIIREE